VSFRALSSAIPWRAPPEPSQPPAQNAAPVSPRAAVGVDFLLEAAGGEAAVVRAAAGRLPRLFRDATPLEATEALALTLVDRAPEAVAQLGVAASDAISEAARTLYRNARRNRAGIW
jgi:hypothetical protein